MTFCLERAKTRYQLRYAAGIYWLLDMEQPGVPYRKPLPLNQTGAEIWSLLVRGMEPEEMAKGMSERHSVPEEEIRRDIQDFYEQLKKCGIIS